MSFALTLSNLFTLFIGTFLDTKRSTFNKTVLANLISKPCCALRMPPNHYLCIMKFEITILGCGSATPTMKHGPTAQILNHHEQYFLFDCGEGTQLQLRRFNIKFQRINHIFITHLHGDHCLGLPGLISTMNLLGRTNDLHIYIEESFREALELQLKVSYSRLRFNLVWHPLTYDKPQVIFENKKIQIESIPLHHGIPCCGFRINEKPLPRNMIPEMIDKYNIPFVRIRQIKQGADFVLPDGSVIPNDELTIAPEPPASYAFCTDTAFSEKTIAGVKGIDVLYHESTFLEAQRNRAKETFHSTAKDAATVALRAEAKHLVLGHYSARYADVDGFVEEASSIFPSVIAADEGLKINVYDLVQQVSSIH